RSYGSYCTRSILDRELLPPSRQQGGEAVGREAGLVEQQTVHLFHDIGADVVAGPAQALEVFADLIAAAFAEFVGLAADVSLVNPEQPGPLALAEAVAQAQAEDQHLVFGQAFEPFAGAGAELLQPAAVLRLREHRGALLQLLLR